MATKPLKSITFPGIDNVYTVPQVDATLTQTGAAADAKKTGDEISGLKNDLNQKADKTDALSAYVVETATGSIASFTDGADDVPVKDLTIAIEPVQSGSGDPAPTNIRPISGWAGANVTVNGINQWDEQWELGFIRASDGVEVSDNTRIRTKGFNRCLPNTAYYVLDPTHDNNVSFRFYDADENYISSTSWIGDTTITTPASAYYFKFVMASNYGTTYNHDISINYPATDTTHHAYNGSSVSVDWTTEAGTVYGGTLDVTTGVLTVDSGYIASYNGETLPSTWISDRDVYASGATPTTGAQVVYKLATPQTYQLTAHEVSTILGQNNIFADCGDVTVQYRSDTKLYIDKVLNA